MRLIRALALSVLAALPLAAQKPAAGETVVYLVRHAEKANATERDPSLSEAGAERAKALATAMKGQTLDAIFVTQFKRTAETAAPTAAEKKITPTVVAADKSPADHAAEVAKAVMERKGKSVLIVGHSNTVTAIIAALGGPKWTDMCDAAYAPLFTVRIAASGAVQISRATYGKPDAADVTTCGDKIFR